MQGPLIWLDNLFQNEMAVYRESVQFSHSHIQQLLAINFHNHKPHCYTRLTTSNKQKLFPDLMLNQVQPVHFQ